MNPINSLKEKEHKTESKVLKKYHYFHGVIKVHISYITEIKLRIHHEYESYKLMKTLFGCTRTSDLE